MREQVEVDRESGEPLTIEEINWYRTIARVTASRYGFGPSARRFLATITAYANVLGAMTTDDWQAIVAACAACGEAAQVEQDPNIYCERHDYLMSALEIVNRGAR